MTLLLFFSDSIIPAIASMSIVLLLVILIGPFFVFYWVFRNEDKRIREQQIVGNFSKWLSLICAVPLLIISLVFIVISWTYTGKEYFSPLNSKLGDQLLIVTIFSAALTFVFGVISLPRWQGFIGVSCFILYITYFLSL